MNCVAVLNPTRLLLQVLFLLQKPRSLGGDNLSGSMSTREALNKILNKGFEVYNTKLDSYGCVLSGEENVTRNFQVLGKLRVLGILECQKIDVRGIVQVLGEVHIGVWGE